MTSDYTGYVAEPKFGPFQPDAARVKSMPADWDKREAIIRSKEKWDTTCFRCGEDRLMWRLDWHDGETKLFKPYSFHVCPDGVEALARDRKNY